MTKLPEMTFLDEPRTESELKNQFFGNIVGILSEMLGGAPVSKLFIASGTVVPTAANHTLDTEGGVSSDELATVDVINHPEGRILTLSCADNSRAITIKHGMGGSGQVILNDFQDLTLNDTRDRLFLQRVDTYWEEMFRAGPSFKNEPVDPDTVVAPSGVLPALDGSQLTGLPNQDVPNWLIQSTMRNTMHRLTDEGLSKFGLSGSTIDEFVDETGIDATACSGVVYTSGQYSNCSYGQTSIMHTAGGSITASGERAGTYGKEKAADGGSSTEWYSDQTSNVWWSYDLGTGNDKRFWKWGCRITMSSSYVGAARCPSRITFQGSNDGSTWTDIDDQTGLSWSSALQVRYFEVPITSSYRYIRYANMSASTNLLMNEFYVFDAALNDMMLQSNTHNALTPPETVHALIRAEFSGTLNADFKGEISRDGGTTWTEGVLSKIADEGAVDYYETLVDVSGQPAGTDIKYKITSHNFENLIVHAVGLNW